jgi:hypothetical protein
LVLINNTMSEKMKMLSQKFDRTHLIMKTFETLQEQQKIRTDEK